MKALIWFVLTFGALLLALSAVVLYLQSRRRETQDEVLARLQMGVADEASEAGGGLVITKVQNPVVRFVYKHLWQAGYEVEAKTVANWLIVAGVVTLLLVWLAGFFLGLFTVLFFVLVGNAFLQRRAARRNQQIIAQLPDFLEHAMRAITAGNTLEEAFATAARTSQEPLRSLFTGVSRQVRLGAPIEEALTQAAMVQDLPDVHVLAMSARVNRRYGGSIRNMIKSMIQVIRQRETAVRELRALTAETRISATVLAAIPIGITLFVLYRNPVYYAAMWADTAGRFWLIGGFFWQILGVVVLWRMMRSVSNV